MTLKTLKDIKSIQAAFDHADNSFGSEWKNTKQLKQEAIKWVKDMMRQNDIEKLFSNPNELFYAIEKFKIFFNISKEDLI